jgi:CubicO group peptidase (beta-lactamase class C family)
MVQTSKLDAILQGWMDRQQTPGLAAAIVVESRIALLRGYGRTSAEEGAAPVSETTLFRIALTTKLLVGTVVMRLVEQGALAVDAPISSYLPWLRLSQVGLEDQITLRHLLSHTSGLCHFPADFTSRDPDGLDVWAHERLPRYPALTPPGQVWLYSNTGLSLAAYVALSVTATPFPLLMQELLFAPLGMEHTTFDPLVALTYPCALGHTRRADGGWEVDHQFVQNTAWDPAGGALSCVHDLAQVALMYLRHDMGSKQHLLTDETIQLMQTPQVKTWTRDEGGYGLTWATTEYKGHALVRHTGGGVSSYQSVFVLAPTEDVGVVLLANGGLKGELVEALLDAVLPPAGRVFQLAMPPNEEADWSACCGTYLGPYTGLVVVESEDEGLRLTKNGRRYILEPHCHRHYLGTADDSTEAVSVGFPTGQSGAQHAEFLVVDDSPCQRLTSLPVLSADPTTWTQFAGSYELPGGSLTLERRLDVEVEGETLLLTRGTQRMHCLPITATTFACDAGMITFLSIADEIILEFQQTMQARRLSGHQR